MAIEKIFSYGEFEGDGAFDFSPATDYKFCVFSDLHHGYDDYNVFHCKDGLDRLKLIVDESADCDFFLSLGDFADNLLGGVKPYEELKETLAKRKIRLYTGDKKEDGEKYLFNVVGNHEIAYMQKSDLQNYTPYVDGVGNVFSFAHGETVFLAYDAIFSAKTGKDTPADILPCLTYTIPDKTIEYLKALLDKQTPTANSIVAFSHICLKCIEESAKEKLLELLLSYRLPVYIFEGHAHRENYQLFANGTVEYAHVFTLPAVTDGDTYNRYEVVMRNGKLLRITAFEKPFIKGENP